MRRGTVTPSIAAPEDARRNGGGLALGVPLGVTAMALVIRVVYLIETRDVPLLRHLVGDAATYFAWANRIAEGNWIGSESFYQAPLYPYFLATLFVVADPQVWIVRAAQAVMGAAACGLLSLATGAHFGRRAGMVAGLMAALYPPWIFFDGIVQKASLATFLVCALLATMSFHGSRPRVKTAIGAGLILALLVLARENALVWVPVLAVWLPWPGLGPGEGRSAARAWRSLLMFALGLGAVLGPVAWRNYHIAGAWTLSTFQSGPNFYIGNRDGASGRYEPLVRGHETPVFERADATKLAEEAAGRSLSPQEVSDYWWRRAIGEIGSNPGGWVALLCKKSLMVINAYEVSDAEGLVVYADASWLLRALQPFWHFGVLLPLAAVGMVFRIGQLGRYWHVYALLVTMVAAVAVFYIMARYRFPVVPLLVMFAADGAVEAVRRVRVGQWRRSMAALSLGAGVALVGNVRVYEEERLDALAWMNVGVSLAQGGDIPAAEVYFRKAVGAHPESPEAHLNLAQSLAVQGKYEAAIPHYQYAHMYQPNLPGVHYNLAVAFERTGRYRYAIEWYEEALRFDPNDEDVARAISRLEALLPEPAPGD